MIYSNIEAIASTPVTIIKVETLIVLGDGDVAIGPRNVTSKEESYIAVAFRQIDPSPIGKSLLVDDKTPELLIVIKSLESLKVLEKAIRKVHKSFTTHE